MGEDRHREEQEFSFVKEKIKHQPIYQNKRLRKAVMHISMAILYGVIACFVFVQIHPWMEQKFGEEEATEITLPEEEADVPETEVLQEEPQEPIVITEARELEIEDYRKLYQKLESMAVECERSLVTVTAANSDTDWFNKIYKSKDQLSGLLVGNNGVELLILTSYSGIEAADQLQATFADQVTHEATLKN